MAEVIFLSFGLFFASARGDPSGVKIRFELLAIGGGGVPGRSGACGNVSVDPEAGVKFPFELLAVGRGGVNGERG